jgi:acyl carrier protein
VGGLGQLDRCASSTFLAALAEAGAARAWQRGEDTLVTAVEWSPFVWESPESAGTGLGGLEERRRRDTERFGIRADEAGQVLMRILAARPAQPSPRVVVSPRNLLQHMRAAQGITAESLFRELGATHQEGEGENRRQGLSSDLVAPRSDLERSLTQVWEEMFGIERIGVQDNFFELGGHSLLAIQVVTRMREVTGFDLPMTVLFDAPTVEQLAALVMGQEVESLDDEEMTGFAELFEQVEEMDPEEVQRLLSDAQG